MATSKDYERMETLKAYTRTHGLAAGIDKAVRDAEKIEHLTKCESRARILRQGGYGTLAVAFENRALFLKANGVLV